MTGMFCFRQKGLQLLNFPEKNQDSFLSHPYFYTCYLHSELKADKTRENAVKGKYRKVKLTERGGKEIKCHNLCLHERIQCIY